MPRYTAVLNTRIEQYAELLRRKRRAPKTITDYSRLLRQAMNAWHAAGMEWAPSKVGEEEIDYLLNEVYTEIDPMTARLQVAIIGTWLKRMGSNPIVEVMELEWPQDERINAKWLSPQEAKALMDGAVGMERIMVHLELCCLLRRCEVMRLRVQDFRDGAIDIWGKGRMGGKRRTIPYHPKTWQELEQYMELREALITRVREKDPTAEVPDAVMIYERHGRLGAYGKSALDIMLKEAGERAGIPEDRRCHHVNRRTGARILHLCGKRTRVIMKILGHSSEEQTIRYMGLNLDDMSDAFQGADEYMEFLQTGTNRVEPAL